MLFWEVMYVGEIRVVICLWWIIFWVFNNIVFCIYIRRVVFVFVGIIWICVVYIRFSVIGDDGVGFIVKIKVRDMYLVVLIKVVGVLFFCFCMFI